MRLLFVAVHEYERDPEWRPLDPEGDNLEIPERGKEYGLTYAEDRSVYYYWRRRTS